MVTLSHGWIPGRLWIIVTRILRGHFLLIMILLPQEGRQFNNNTTFSGFDDTVKAQTIQGIQSVSYTHLDVYKRQQLDLSMI